MTDIPKLFGIDVGYGALKVIETERQDKAFTIKALGHAPLGRDYLIEDTEDGLDKLAKALSDAVKDAKTSTKNCVITVPESLVYPRLLSIPDLSQSAQDQGGSSVPLGKLGSKAEKNKNPLKNIDEKIAEQVYWALKPLIPVEMETVNVSFLEVSKYQLNGQNFTDWYAVAAPKILVDKVQRFVEKAGFTLLAVETEALANTRTVKANYQLIGDVLIVDFGMHSSHITLVRNGNTAFSQSVDFGSEKLTADLSATFSIDPGQADQYKMQIGLNAEGENASVAQALVPTVDRLVEEIRRMITYSKVKLRSQGISGVFIMGGGSRLPQLSKYVNEKLQIQTVIVDPYRGFKLSKQMSERVLQSSATMDFSIAIGLSLKGII